jgi:hypothetical protein
LNELNLLNSALIQLSPENPYRVPEGYFEGLADHVLSLIKAQNQDSQHKDLATFSRELPYTVPAEYFDGLEERLMQNIRESSDYQSPQEELLAVSPFLSGFKKQNPYTVPTGYFDSIPVRKPAAKVISITTGKWFRYAAAAVVIGIISIAAIFYINGKSTRPADENKAWAKIEKKVNKLSDQEIKDFVELSDAVLTGSETAGLQPVKKEEVKELLINVSDNELKEFLEQTSDGVNDITDTELR